MDRHHNDAARDSREADNRRDLEPGRGDRNLLSSNRSEAPVDRDQPMIKNVSDEGGDEHYMDEELHDPRYFQDRAGSDVRK